MYRLKSQSNYLQTKKYSLWKSNEKTMVSESPIFLSEMVKSCSAGEHGFLGIDAIIHTRREI